MNDFDSRCFRCRALAVIEISYGQRLSFGAVHKSLAKGYRDAMGGRAVDLPIDHIGVDHDAVVPDDEITQHFDFAGGLIDFDDRSMSAGRKRKLRSHQAISVGDDIWLGMGKSVVERGLQSGFHTV